MDNLSEKRITTIRELESRGVKKCEPENRELPMSTPTYYMVFSLMLFLITYHIPALMNVWKVLGGLGIIVGIILLAKKILKRINPDL